MLNFLKKLFGLEKNGLPKYVKNNYYLLIETLKPIIPAGEILHFGWFDEKIYDYGKKKNVGRVIEDKKYNAVIAIETGQEPETFFEFIEEGGELFYIEAAVSHPRWKGKSLKKKYPKATAHPIAIHWWLIHFKKEVIGDA